MKVTFISVYESNVALGMCTLSAVLKRAGFETQMIFLPRETEGLRWAGFRYAYSERVPDQVAGLVGDSALIGISLMSNYFDNPVNGLFRLFQFGYAPRWLMVWLLQERMRHLNWGWLPYLINRLILAWRLAGAGWRALRVRVGSRQSNKRWV